MTIKTPQSRASQRWTSHAPWLALVAISGAIIFALGARAWLVLLLDGVYVAAVLAAAAGWGAWPGGWLAGRRRPMLQQVCLAIGLGLGVLSTLTLALGAAESLNATSAGGLLAVGIAAGAAYVWAMGRRQEANTQGKGEGLGDSGTRGSEAGDAPLSSFRSHASTLAHIAAAALLGAPLAIAIFGATLPPGILWAGEARGYDVLEYHLQCPREYYDAGAIHFLPHNVYASFPQQMETLYLLLMHVAGGPMGAAIASQLLHAACGVLAVLTLLAWTPRGWPQAVVAVLVAGVPWLAYLGCLAYVELGMLLMTSLAACLIYETLTDPTRATWRMAVAAGLVAGIAGGCKYTALVFVGVGLGMAWLATVRVPMHRRMILAGVFGAGVLLAFAPWLIRNAAFTGNPIYPFAYNIFGGAAWSDGQAAQWAAGHQPPEGVRSLFGRLSLMGHELFSSGMFNPLLFVAAGLAAVRRRDRVVACLIVWMAVALAAWGALTQIPGRFVVPIVVPLGLIVSHGLRNRDGASAGRATAAVACVLALVGGVLGTSRMLNLYGAEAAWWRNRQISPAELPGAVHAMAEAQTLNQVLPEDARVWLVGEARVFYLRPTVHYTVVFSRDPWIEYAAEHTPAQAIDWLRTQNVTHVVFSWPEIERLRTTYGFAPVVTPEWVAQLRDAGLQQVPGVADIDPTLEVLGVPPG